MRALGIIENRQFIFAQSTRVFAFFCLLFALCRRNFGSGGGVRAELEFLPLTREFIEMLDDVDRYNRFATPTQAKGEAAGRRRTTICVLCKLDKLRATCRRDKRQHEHVHRGHFQFFGYVSMHVECIDEAARRFFRLGRSTQIACNNNKKLFSAPLKNSAHFSANNGLSARHVFLPSQRAL